MYYYLKIILPLSLPGLAAVSTIVFITSWNEFIAAVTFTSSDVARTIPVGVQMFLGYYYMNWGYIMAAAMLSSIPAVILFLFLQKQMVAGLTRGALKG